MQLRLQPKFNSAVQRRNIIIKIILIVLFFFLAIFLLDKIEVSVSNKLIKQEISNEKLKTLK